jgi:hypothetical protein
MKERYIEALYLHKHKYSKYSLLKFVQIPEVLWKLYMGAPKKSTFLFYIHFVQNLKKSIKFGGLCTNEEVSTLQNDNITAWQRAFLKIGYL